MGLLALLRKLKRNDREARILMLGLDCAGKTTILKVRDSLCALRVWWWGRIGASFIIPPGLRPDPCVRRPSPPQALSEETINQVMPTQGFNVKSLTRDGFKLQVWDIGGCARVSPSDGAGAIRELDRAHIVTTWLTLPTPHAHSHRQRATRQHWKDYFEQTDGLESGAHHIAFTGWVSSQPQLFPPDATEPPLLSTIQVFVVDSADRKRVEEAVLELRQLVGESKLDGIPVLIFSNKQDLAAALSAAEVAEALQLQGIRNHQWQIQACSAKQSKGLQEGLEWLVRTLDDRAGGRAPAPSGSSSSEAATA